MRRLLAKAADFIRESDKILLIICIFTSLYGCAAVFSATHYRATYRPFLIQFICFAAGVVAALIISAVDYSKILRYWYLAAALGVIPVMLTFFIGFAPEGTDDKAWLDLGFTTFQPAELLKICFVLTFSAHISAVKPNINKLKYLIPVCLHGAFPVLLIHFQGDDGTALVFAVMVVFMLWAAGVSKSFWRKTSYAGITRIRFKAAQGPFALISAGKSPSAPVSLSKPVYPLWAKSQGRGIKTKSLPGLDFGGRGPYN